MKRQADSVSSLPSDWRVTSRNRTLTQRTLMKNLKTFDFVRAVVASTIAVSLSLCSTTMLAAQNPPPPPTPPQLPAPGERPDSQIVSVGSYRLQVPRDIVVTTLRSGAVQL